jgi:hypothetical protein
MLKRAYAGIKYEDENTNEFINRCFLYDPEEVILDYYMEMARQSAERLHKQSQFYATDRHKRRKLQQQFIQEQQYSTECKM